jgi:hypothetical protein
MKVKLCAAIVAAVAIGGLGMAGASASPVTASVPVAHCNVILADGYSPCFPWPICPINPRPIYPINPRPICPINPGGPMKPVPVTTAS